MTPEGPSIMKRSRFMKLSESLYVILYPIFYVAFQIIEKYL